MSMLDLFWAEAADDKYAAGVRQCRSEILEKGIEMRLPISTLSALCGVSEEDAAQTADFLGVDPAELGYHQASAKASAQ